MSNEGKREAKEILNCLKWNSSMVSRIVFPQNVHVLIPRTCIQVILGYIARRNKTVDEIKQCKLVDLKIQKFSWIM